jgi:DNA segregation ATPase FtsK/SpoIIIE, S-DNA-T family
MAPRTATGKALRPSVNWDHEPPSSPARRRRAYGGSGTRTDGDLFDRAVEIVRRDRNASTSYLQRRLSIGYNRAATLIERMEKEGVISEANAAGKREILLDVLDED